MTPSMSEEAKRHAENLRNIAGPYFGMPGSETASLHAAADFIAAQSARVELLERLLRELDGDRPDFCDNTEYENPPWCGECLSCRTRLALKGASQ